MALGSANSHGILGWTKKGYEMTDGKSTMEQATDLIAVLTASHTLKEEEFFELLRGITEENLEATEDILYALCSFTWGMADGAGINLGASLRVLAPRVYTDPVLNPEA